MREELEQKLLERFPFYEAVHVWTGEKLGLPTGASCGDGWYEIIYKLCEKIEQELIKYPGFNFYFSDIKEKYGTLRIYSSSVPSGSKIFDYINEAESESEKVCEICGSKDDVELRTIGWWRTLCGNCRK